MNQHTFFTYSRARENVKNNFAIARAVFQRKSTKISMSCPVLDERDEFSHVERIRGLTKRFSRAALTRREVLSSKKDKTRRDACAIVRK